MEMPEVWSTLRSFALPDPGDEQLETFPIGKERLLNILDLMKEMAEALEWTMNSEYLNKYPETCGVNSCAARRSALERFRNWK